MVEVVLVHNYEPLLSIVNYLLILTICIEWA